MRKQTNNGTLFTLVEFLEYCDDGGFDDNDGFGYLATADEVSNVEIIPSWRRRTVSQHPWATHVIWFNK